MLRYGHRAAPSVCMYSSMSIIKCICWKLIHTYIHTYIPYHTILTVLTYRHLPPTSLRSSRSRPLLRSDKLCQEDFPSPSMVHIYIHSHIHTYCTYIRTYIHTYIHTYIPPNAQSIHTHIYDHHRLFNHYLAARCLRISDAVRHSEWFKSGQLVPERFVRNLLCDCIHTYIHTYIQ